MWMKTMESNTARGVVRVRVFSEQRDDLAPTPVRKFVFEELTKEKMPIRGFDIIPQPIPADENGEPLIKDGMPYPVNIKPAGYMVDVTCYLDTMIVMTDPTKL